MYILKEYLYILKEMLLDPFFHIQFQMLILFFLFHTQQYVTKYLIFISLDTEGVILSHGLSAFNKRWKQLCSRRADANGSAFNATTVSSGCGWKSLSTSVAKISAGKRKLQRRTVGTKYRSWCWW